MLADRTFDAVVLDVSMPYIDGIEVCRRLRAADNRTPILMLTARDAVDDRVAGLEAGADDYLVKPFALRELRRAAAGDHAPDGRARRAPRTSSSSPTCASTASSTVRIAATRCSS